MSQLLSDRPSSEQAQESWSFRTVDQTDWTETSLPSSTLHTELSTQPARLCFLPSFLLSVHNRGAHIGCVNTAVQWCYSAGQSGNSRHRFDFGKWPLAGSGSVGQVWTTEMYHCLKNWQHEEKKKWYHQKKVRGNADKYQQTMSASFFVRLEDSIWKLPFKSCTHAHWLPKLVCQHWAAVDDGVLNSMRAWILETVKAQRFVLRKCKNPPCKTTEEGTTNFHRNDPVALSEHISYELQYYTHFTQHCHRGPKVSPTMKKEEHYHCTSEHFWWRMPRTCGFWSKNSECVLTHTCREGFSSHGVPILLLTDWSTASTQRPHNVPEIAHSGVKGVIILPYKWSKIKHFEHRSHKM